MTKLAYIIVSVASPNTSDDFEAAYPSAIPVWQANEFKNPAGRKLYLFKMRFDLGESLADLDQFGPDLQTVLAEDAETRVSLISYNAAVHQSIMQDGVAKDILLSAGMKEKTYA